MWHGVIQYVLFTFVTGVVLHAFSRRWLLCTIGGAVLCSILNLVHEAWVADWNVNFAWAPPMFIIGVFLALPAFALAGFLWLLVRAMRPGAQ